MNPLYFSPWETIPLPDGMNEHERRAIDLNENGGIDSGFEAWRAFHWLKETESDWVGRPGPKTLLAEHLLGLDPRTQTISLYGHTLRWQGVPLDFPHLFLLREALRVFPPRIVRQWADGVSPLEPPLTLTDGRSLTESVPDQQLRRRLQRAEALYDRQTNRLIFSRRVFDRDPDMISQIATHELWHAFSDFQVRETHWVWAGFGCLLPNFYREELADEGLEEAVTADFTQRILPLLWRDTAELGKEVRSFHLCSRIRNNCLPAASVVTATRKLQLDEPLWDFTNPQETFAHLMTRLTYPLWRSTRRPETFWAGERRPALPLLEPLKETARRLLNQ